MSDKDNSWRVLNDIDKDNKYQVKIRLNTPGRFYLLTLLAVIVGTLPWVLIRDTMTYTLDTVDKNKDYTNTTCQLYYDISNVDRTAINSQNAGGYIYYVNSDVIDQYNYNHKSDKYQTEKLYGICTNHCPLKNEVVCNYEYYNTYPIPSRTQMQECFGLGSGVTPDSSISAMCNNCWISNYNTYPLYYRCVTDYKDILPLQSEIDTYQKNQKTASQPTISISIQNGKIIQESIPAVNDPIPLESTWCLSPYSPLNITDPHYISGKSEKCFMGIPTGKTYNMLMSKLHQFMSYYVFTIISDYSFGLLFSIAACIIAYGISCYFLAKRIPLLVRVSVAVYLVVGGFTFIYKYILSQGLDLSSVLTQIKQLITPERLMELSSMTGGIMKKEMKGTKKVSTIKKLGSFGTTIQQVLVEIQPYIPVIALVTVALFFSAFFIRKHVQNMSYMYKSFIKGETLLTIVIVSVLSYICLLIFVLFTIYPFASFADYINSFVNYYHHITSLYGNSNIDNFLSSHPFYTKAYKIYKYLQDYYMDLDSLHYIIYFEVYLFGVICFTIINYFSISLCCSIYSWYYGKKWKSIHIPRERADQLLNEHNINNHGDRQHTIIQAYAEESRHSTLMYYLRVNALEYLGIIFFSGNVSFFCYLITPTKYTSIKYIISTIFVIMLSRLNIYATTVSICRDLSITDSYNFTFNVILNSIHYFVISLSASRVIQTVFVLFINATGLQISSIMSADFDIQIESASILQYLKEGWLYLLAHMNYGTFDFYFKNLFATLIVTNFITTLNVYLFAFWEEKYYIDYNMNNNRSFLSHLQLRKLGYEVEKIEDPNENNAKIDNELAGLLPPERE